MEMKKVNLAIINTDWSNNPLHNTIELWDITEQDHVLLDRVKFDYNELNIIAIGCYEITFKNILRNNEKGHIDKVVSRYEKCKLTIELYKEYELIEKYEVNNEFLSIQKYNVSMFIEMF